MNKLIFFLSILAIVSLLLTGCNSKGNVTAQPTPSSPAVTTPTPPPVSAPATASTDAAVPSASNIPGAGGSIWRSPTGRTASYVIAASDATAREKAQADVVCDGVADDVEINETIVNLSPNGGIVQLVGKSFHLAAPIKMYDSTVNGGVGYYVWLRGEGWMKTALTVGAHLNINAINFDVGASATGGFKRISDLLINGNKSYQESAGYGISITTAGFAVSDVIIENVWVDDTFSDGFHLLSTWGLRVGNCLAESCGGSGLYVTGNQGYIDCFYSQLNSGEGIHIQGNKFIVNNCQVKSSGLSGIRVSSSFNVVSSCLVNIWGTVTGSNAFRIDNSDNVVTGNVVYGDGSSGCVGGMAISNDRGVYTGNHIEGCVTDCIQLNSGADNNVITGNTLKSGTAYPIYNLATGFNTLQHNDGYLAPGEVRTISGGITGTASDNGAIMLSVDNPFGQAVRVQKVNLEITVNASAAATMNCGIGSSMTGNYNTIISALPINPGTTYPYFYSSDRTATYGVQVDAISWATGSGNRYLNFFNPSANASGTVFRATYTITVMGN